MFAIQSAISETTWPHFAFIKESTKLWNRITHAFKQQPEPELTLHQPNITTLCRVLCTSEFHILKKQVQPIITNLSQQELGTLFEALTTDAIQSGSLQGLQRCLSLIPLETLKKTLDNAIKEQQSTPEEVLKTFAYAEQEYQKLVKSSEESFVDQQGNRFFKVVTSIIDGLIISFHIKELGKEITTAWEAANTLQAYVTLVGIPSGIFGALSTFCTPVVALIVTGVIMATLALGTWAYIRWIQKSPETVDSKAVNLSTEAKLGTLAPVLARDQEIDAVLTCLSLSSTEQRMHPLLLGPSGVGKSELVRGIAQRLATGNVPTCLKGKKLLALNTADLFEAAGKAGSDFALQQILDRMDNKKGDYIVFFDEVHNAMKKNALVAERLKTVLDLNPNSLPYCIAATTEEEYKEFIEPNLAFARRFQRIEIKPTTCAQTVLILREMLNREAPELTVSDKTLKKIYTITTEKMPNLFQPASSKNLLAKAISAIQQPQSSALQKQKQKLAMRISSLHANPQKHASARFLGKITKIQAKIKTLEENQKAHELKAKELKGLIRFKNQQQKELFKSAVGGDLKTFLLWNYFLLPNLTLRINAFEHSHGINEELIDTLAQIGNV